MTTTEEVDCVVVELGPVEPFVIEIGDCGERGPAGLDGGTRYLTPAVDVLAYTLVTVLADDLAHPASSIVRDDATRVAGLTLHASPAGTPVQVMQVGEVTTIASLPIGPLYLGRDGGLTPVRDNGLFQLWVATALSAHRLQVNIHTAITL